MELDLDLDVDGLGLVRGFDRRTYIVMRARKRHSLN